MLDVMVVVSTTPEHLYNVLAPELNPLRGVLVLLNWQIEVVLREKLRIIQII